MNLCDGVTLRRERMVRLAGSPSIHAGSVRIAYSIQSGADSNTRADVVAGA